jgi:hypothetical protein
MLYFMGWRDEGLGCGDRAHWSDGQMWNMI